MAKDSTLSPEHLAAAILDGDRPNLARAITLVESQRITDREVGYEVLRRIMDHTGGAHRVAISGPPGVGKSTLIESLGLLLTERGGRVAVLAIDPSSSMSGGSILGDKSRMSRLAQEERAFIRPSPTDLSLGGVARRTREAMMLCEAAGFDHVIVETVGVGQSEIKVAAMVDSFVVLVQPGSGDELQGIKRGILELADLLVVTKADGDQSAQARDAASDASAALRYRTSAQFAWTPRVLTLSSLTGDGVPQLVEALDEHRTALAEMDATDSTRTADLEDWLRDLTEESLVRRLLGKDTVSAERAAATQLVGDGQESALGAAERLVAAILAATFDSEPRSPTGGGNPSRRTQTSTEPPPDGDDS